MHITRIGDTGSTVTFLQQRLNAKGFHVTVDGTFGPGTESVVEQFQASCGLSADGVVGPLTWNSLQATGHVSAPADVLTEQRLALTSRIPLNTPASIRSVLEVAILQLGKKEIPDGSNGGPALAHIVDEGGDGKPPSAYYTHWGITDPSILKSMPPWCAIFVCWALREGLGAQDWKHIPFGDWFGGASQIEDWAKKQGCWHSITDTVHALPVGAVFTISREKSGSDAATATGAGHVGLVICDNGDGSVTTVEGNVGNRVNSYRRKKTDLRGYLTWSS